MKTTSVISLLYVSLGLYIGQAAPFTLDCGYFVQINGSSVYRPCLISITANCDSEGNTLDPGSSWWGEVPALPGVPPPQLAPPKPGTYIPNVGSEAGTSCQCDAGGPTGPGLGDGPYIAQCKSCGAGGDVPTEYVRSQEPGMPSWSVTEPALTFWLRDVPVWTQPGRGNPLKFKLTYKQRVAFDSITNIFGFGPGWTGNCQAYATAITDHTNMVLVQQGDGSSTVYDVTAGNNFYSRSKLTRRDPNGYELTAPGGTDQLFTNFYRVSGIARNFLSAFNPGDGSPGTTFSYLQTNGAVRLTSARDRAGRDTTFAYTSAQNYGALISQIATPSGATAGFAYNSNGYLTNISDACNNMSQFCYDNSGRLTNMITPYGSTTFYFNSNSTDWEVLWVQEYGLRSYLFVYLDEDTTGRIPTAYTNEVPNTGSMANTFDTTNLHKRNSFFWGPRQFELLSASVKASLSNATFTPDVLASADFLRSRQRNWLLPRGVSSGPPSTTVSLERSPSADGNTPGPIIWYDYLSKVAKDQEGFSKQPSLVAWKRPDGQSAFIATTRNSWGLPTDISQTYSATAGSLGLATDTYTYDDDNAGNHVLAFADALSRGTTYGYNNGDLVSATNALGYAASYSWSNGVILTFTNGPVVQGAQFVRLFSYGDTNHPGLPTRVTDLATGSTNSFTYSNGLIVTETTPGGLTVTNLYDALGRRVCVTYPDGTYTSNAYSVLHLAGTRDRLGNWTRYGHDSHGRLVSTTNALGNVTAYSYCNCGSLESTTDALNNTTTFTYDDLGRRIRTTLPDNSWTENQYNLLQEVTNVTASSGYSVTNWYNNRGVIYASSNAAGLVVYREFDVASQVTNSVGSDGVANFNFYDALGRLTQVQRNDTNNVQEFTYDSTGLISSTLDLQMTTYANDVAGRRYYEEDPNGDGTEFSYDADGNLTRLNSDVNGHATTWAYDVYGRVTQKNDDNNQTVFTYAYDAAGRLTNRWTPAKGNTGYAYDAMGNLTNVDYPTSPDFHLSYDALGRLTNMVDAVGITRYQYTSAGQLQSEDGPFDNDLVSYGYTNRLRQSLNLAAAPGGAAWTQSFGYDSAGRLTSLTSPAGSFAYSYGASPANRPSNLALPGGSQIAYTYDPLARLTATELKDATANSVNRHSYNYTARTDRIASMTRLDTNVINYGYDPNGQLVTARGYEATQVGRLQEQFGYRYDSGGNLSWRTNCGLVEQFTVNNLNQLTNYARGAATGTVAGATSTAATNVTINGRTANRYADFTFALGGFTLADGTNTFTAVAFDALGRVDTNTVIVNFPAAVAFAYDANGNMTTNGSRVFEYDDENQLIRITEPNAWRSVFTYDGTMRRRERWESAWDGAHWVSNLLVRYVYDGKLPLQERHYDPRLTTSVPQRTLTYTRGRDLSGRLQGAGGIAGLLARTDSGFTAQPSVYYHCDNVGNVSALVNSNGVLVGRYWYDPFGNTIALAGAAAEANLYRFSSKEWHEKSGLVYYLYRYYAPSLQRWINRDPSGEPGFEVLRSGQGDPLGDGPNLYAYVLNSPVNRTDALGLDGETTLAGEPTLLMDEEALAAYRAKCARCAIFAAAVQTAKKAVGALGGAKSKDSCAVLQAKTAAWLALAVARSRLNNICFNGGDATHQDEAAKAWAQVGKAITLQTEKGCLGSPTGSK